MLRCPLVCGCLTLSLCVGCGSGTSPEAEGKSSSQAPAMQLAGEQESRPVASADRKTSPVPSSSTSRPVLTINPSAEPDDNTLADVLSTPVQPRDRNIEMVAATVPAASPSTERPGADAAFARLLTAHRGGNASDWERAYEELITFGPTAAPVVITKLDATDRQVRELASILLPVLDGFPAEMEDRLLTALDTGSPMVRSNVATLFSQSLSHPERVVPVLGSLLPAADVELQKQIVITLGNYGESARETLPSLKRIVNTASDGELKRFAREAIGQIEASAQ